MARRRVAAVRPSCLRGANGLITAAREAQTVPRAPFPDLEFRPLESTDRERLAAAFARLSPQSRYQRFLTPKPKLLAGELDELTQLDHVTRDAVVAVERGTDRLVGVARYGSHPGDDSAADVAVTIADDWQGRGLGLKLTCMLLDRAARHGIARVTATVLDGNARSRSLLRRLGFRARRRDGNVLEFGLELRPTIAVAPIRL